MYSTILWKDLTNTNKWGMKQTNKTLKCMSYEEGNITQKVNANIW